MMDQHYNFNPSALGCSSCADGWGQYVYQKGCRCAMWSPASGIQSWGASWYSGPSGVFSGMPHWLMPDPPQSLIKLPLVSVQMVRPLLEPSRKKPK